MHARVTIDSDVKPRFTATYLRVANGECAFVEAHTSHATPRMLDALREAGKKPEDVRYVIVTHAHLDHAAGAGSLLAACPNATLLAHPRTAKNLIDPEKLIKGATAVYGEARFRELYGTIQPIPKERVRALEDDETFELGGATFRALHTFGHAYHHFAIHDVAMETVFTGDVFGLVYPDLQARGRFALPSTSPTGFDAVEAHKSIDRIVALAAKTACLTHFDGYADIGVIADQLRAWVDRAEGWVAEAARGDESVEAIQARLEKAWRAAIEEESTRRGLGFDAAAYDLLALDIELNAQGLAFVANARRNPA